MLGFVLYRDLQSKQKAIKVTTREELLGLLQVGASVWRGAGCVCGRAGGLVPPTGHCPSRVEWGWG